MFTGTPCNEHTESCYSLRVLQVDPTSWDRLIRPFPTKTVFHSSAWLAMLEETTGGRTLLLEVNDGERPVGYFCGLHVRKGPFQLLGSPLPGWGTPVMGPIADPDRFDERAFLRAATRYCKNRGMDLLQICCGWMSATALREAGFLAAEDVTFVMPLPSVESAWSKVQSRTRRYVKQAERSGVRVKSGDDESAIVEHYDLLKEVFAKWLSKPPYGIERPLAMWRHLHPHSLMLLRAVLGERTIATYLLAWDQETMWGLATGSRQDALRSRPNELLHWKAIETACQLGLRQYDLGGGGDYKSKYGGVMTPRVRWTRFYSALASLAYRTAEAAWHAKRETVLALAKLLRS